MTEVAQRNVIALACGFKGIRFVNGMWVGVAPLSKSDLAFPLPDYLGDLNAMHEAVMAQPQDVRMKINDRLMHLIDSTAPYCLDRTINATAAQRAEAFLRVIGKWEE